MIDVRCNMRINSRRMFRKLKRNRNNKLLTKLHWLFNYLCTIANVYRAGISSKALRSLLQHLSYGEYILTFKWTIGDCCESHLILN